MRREEGGVRREEGGVRREEGGGRRGEGGVFFPALFFTAAVGGVCRSPVPSVYSINSNAKQNNK